MDINTNEAKQRIINIKLAMHRLSPTPSIISEEIFQIINLVSLIMNIVG